MVQGGQTPKGGEQAKQTEKVVKPGEHAGTARREPHRYSSDAALRPILVDSIFPTVAHVLGPGEIAYRHIL